MEQIGLFTLMLFFKIASPATITTTSRPAVTSVISPVTTVNNEVPKTSTYQVTENIKDIPDNRTLPPIIPNFGITRPLNFGNNTVLTNIVKEKSEESSEEYTDTQIGGSVKKNTFSILHIKAEYDDKPQQHQNVFRKVFGGIKDYVYHVKKGVVDGLHSFFHHHDDDGIKPVKETDFHEKFPNFHEKHPNRYDQFHRNFKYIEDLDGD